MPEWMQILLTGTGSAAAAFIAAWALLRKGAWDDRQAWFNQIQEERDAADRRAEVSVEAFNAQADRFWADKAASRNHVGALTDHIWQRKPPPPPEPPAGYIP
ncbi:hypothetical protein [Microbacterium allomyrinae]|uniref:Uncharacterized protein n=1 Tax=Microbacterium allomyrinae TaxID=2830666 RepID=A0A9X1S1W5_9MICO|nr:hypothetical protein [Microbacterium allomyrinae]MCC2030630.1 hypothetical protein [Microbacterium allomyrinae]